jgi:hypothetical protein
MQQLDSNGLNISICASGLVDAVQHATACPKGSDNQQRYQNTYHVADPIS